jgi:ABC-2 type transport system permease protein
VLLVVAATAFGGIPVTIWLLYVPVSMITVTLWGTGLALLLSAAYVYLRDVQYIVEVAMMLLFWASPNLYGWQMVQGKFNIVLQEIYLCNPMTLSVMGFQKAIWGDPMQSSYPPSLLPRLLIAMGIGALFLYVSQRIFAQLQRNFAQEI